MNRREQRRERARRAMQRARRRARARARAAEQAGFRAALLETFEGVIAPNDEVGRRRLFVLPHLVESLVHGLTQRPDFISRESAKDEAVRTVRLYLAPA
jgi:hypothetical protein